MGLWKNLLGGICVYLEQYEESEEYFTAAIDILQKQGAEELILRVRNNIGWLYNLIRNNKRDSIPGSLLL
ncbi:tetratricopeptide repeat protein [Bacillus clarus]|uniref:tetratricopeptide repeat protein n=1 Tax=Bacillus clarus TaxID=2338372 RepID=UPI00216B4319|nr:tetratricopeptide repeat protein [Bacillus clarus]